MNRVVASALLGAFLVPMTGNAQIVDEFKPPAGTCCLPTAAQRLADQLQDWNQLGRYHDDNEKLKQQAFDPGRVVFLGDSITDTWRLTQYFPDKPYVNRGISGQTTPQMLVRMFPDDNDIKPAAVIILAGTNDIARNTGPVTLTMIEENIQAMTELAQAHGIKVILCSVTPVSDYGRAKMTPGRPPSDILKINTWMKAYAAKINATFADYFSELVDEKGFLKEGISMDGLHPNAMGFQLMAPVAEAAIQKALK
jgi:lysophospholipase L1-like esterase